VEAGLALEAFLPKAEKAAHKNMRMNPLPYYVGIAYGRVVNSTELIDGSA
jgi:hypothetical protein